MLGCLVLSPVAQATHVVVNGNVSGLLPAPYNVTTTFLVLAHAGDSRFHPDRDGLLHGNGSIDPFADKFVPVCIYELSGSVTGSLVVLSGPIIQSTNELIEGSPVLIEANAATGAVHLTLGPIVGGVFVGQTIEFFGSGKVIIKEH